jgi:tetratricopeptide (TPR) repeat protein
MGRIGDGLRAATAAPFKAVWRLLPWWARLLLIAAIVVVPLAFLNPVVDLFGKLLDLLGRALQPLLETTFGRVLLLLFVFAAIAGVLALLLRARIRQFRGSLVLGRHLQAVALLLGDDHRRCKEQFRRVARYRGPLPPEHPALLQDARLKLARLCLDDGQIDEALAWLTRVVEGRLPKELQRPLAQLRARAMRLQGQLLVETRVAELEAALDRFADDYELLRELRLARGDGDLQATAELQAKILKAAPAVAIPHERQRMIADLDAAGRAAITEGDLDAARACGKRLRAVDRDGPAAGLLLGAVHRAAGDLRAAIREWGATRSPEGLDLVAELLRDHPGAMEPRELLECCPMQGTLLLLAREFARDGQTGKAERAARAAAQALGPTPSVTAVLGEVLQLLGKQQQAALLCEQAVLRLLGHGAAPS